METLKIQILLVVSLFLLTSCAPKRAKHVNIKVVQTTDVHGCIFPYDFIENSKVPNSLASVFAWVREVRLENTDRVILLDNGDYLQGQPSVYYYNYIDTVSAHLGADVFNYMGYDAATVGNHDIEAGHAVYDRFRQQLKMPYLAANATNVSTGKPYFEPYAVIERQGIKVVVLGLITPSVPNWLPEKLWEGMKFVDMVESAKKWIKIIHDKEKPDLVIGMFHSGVDYLHGNPAAKKQMNENASKLVAENVPGFDIILAGHDHKKHLEKVLNVNGDTVYLLNPGSHARSVALIDIDFSFDKHSNKYKKSITAKLVNVENQPADTGFIKRFGQQYKTVKSYVGRQIGEFTKTMDSKWAYVGQSSFMNFVHSIQLQASGADISFASPLTFHTTIQKGPIYVSDLFKLYKYENMLYTINLKGDEIDKYLEYSVSGWFNTMKTPSDHLLKIARHEDGTWYFENSFFNFSSAAGIDYFVDVTRPDGDKVNILGLGNGERFYADSTYTVALNSYRANGGGGHLTIGAGLTPAEIKQRFVASTQHDIRYIIMGQVEHKKVIKPKENSNWRIIPEDYYEFGKRKDMRLLFKKPGPAQ